jgi:hypothetical protein
MAEGVANAISAKQLAGYVSLGLTIAWGLGACGVLPPLKKKEGEPHTASIAKIRAASNVDTSPPKLARPRPAPTPKPQTTAWQVLGKVVPPAAAEVPTSPEQNSSVPSALAVSFPGLGFATASDTNMRADLGLFCLQRLKTCGGDFWAPRPDTAMFDPRLDRMASNFTLVEAFAPGDYLGPDLAGIAGSHQNKE